MALFGLIAALAGLCLLPTECVLVWLSVAFMREESLVRHVRLGARAGRSTLVQAKIEVLFDIDAALCVFILLQKYLEDVVLCLCVQIMVFINDLIDH